MVASVGSGLCEVCVSSVMIVTILPSGAVGSRASATGVFDATS
jgi:hypothetical protein